MTELIREGTLTLEVADVADENFRSHVGGAKQEIDSLHVSGNAAAAAEMSTQLEGTLQAHAAMLSRISGRNTDTRVALRNLLASVKNESRISGQLADKAAESVVVGSSSGSGTRVAVEASMKSAENKIAEVRSFIDAKASIAMAESVIQANARLEVAQSSLDSAQSAWNAGAYADAFQLVRKSLHGAQEAKLLLDWSRSGENDSRSSASSTIHSSTSSTARSHSGSDVSRSVSDMKLRAEAEARIDATAKKIDEVRANIAARAARLSVTAMVQATTKLNTASSLLSEARTKFSLSLYTEATVMANTSFQMAIDVQTQNEDRS